MKNWQKEALRAALAITLAGAALGACSCGSTELCWDDADGRTDTAVPLIPANPGTNGRPPMTADKVDLLLVIDNSRSMADKQKILALAVPDLVESLVNPPCIDTETGAIDNTSQGPLEPCSAGMKRRFKPVTDIHVGIVSSSLGGHGSDACWDGAKGKQSNNDRAHLIARKDPAMAGDLDTYKGLKFLAWDPKQALVPPGEADIDIDSDADPDATALVPLLRDMVIGVGQIGCGYEAQLEAWYRFLVQPDPPEEVTLGSDGYIVLEGTDNVILEQRKAFLRPDSALAVVLLTDENDCSIVESGQAYFTAQQKLSNGLPFHFPKPRALCATDPGDPCCFSCGQTGPKDCRGVPLCDPDPTCKTPDDKPVRLTNVDDNINLRCWDQKRRFGLDFLYPVERYVNALTMKFVTDRNGQVALNPLFTDLDPSDDNTRVRDSGLVFFAGIVGVPWQDIARRNGGGKPDLRNGVAKDGKLTGGLKSPEELSKIVPGTSYTGWDLILGDPANDEPPEDPLMQESIEPRSGKNPITGDVMATSDNPLSNKINGHDFSIPRLDDLQYACISPLVTINPDGTISANKRDCSIVADQEKNACDCDDPANDNPLCQIDPKTGSPTLQVRAKAYPGLRELAVLKALGDQAVVASVCPAQLVDPSGSDFGYRPAMAALVERMKPHFK